MAANINLRDKTTSETKTTKSFEQNLKIVLKLWSDFINSEESLREVSEQLIDKWKKDIASKRRVKCPLKDCNKVFKSKDGLKYHYKRCGLTLKSVIKCKVCGFEALKGNRNIVHHIWINHRESVPQLSADISECIELSVNNCLESEHTFASKATINSAKQFHKPFDEKKSFPNLLPNIHSWNPLKEEDFSNYIPNTNPSVSFRSSLSVEKSWIRLNLFESIGSEQCINLFVGGPVWATAWCPLPLKCNDCIQYVAIASNMNPEIKHTFSDTDIEGGLIQIWNMGILSKQFDVSIKPRMAFSIAHFCGMIWDMEWCPGGTTWQYMTSPVAKNDAIPRLGLLAIACSDGFVRIHSIPHPEGLPSSYDYSLYTNEPVIILNPPGVGNSVNSENTICKCVSWMPSNDQNLIVGGYGSGVIAVWELTTRSSLLIVEQNPCQTILKPVKSWMGHTSPVNRIKWFNTSSNQFVVSCSFDRSAKLWNLKDISLPITVLRKGLFTSVDTNPQFNGMFLAADDSYQAFHNNSTFKDFGYHNFSALSLTTNKSCIWDLSVSQWTTAIACVDAAGEAVIFPNFKFKSDPKLKTYDRIPLYHICPSLLEDNTLQTNSSKSKRGRKSNKNNNNNESISADIPPIRTYEEFTAKYGLVFNDYDLSNLKAIPIDEINRIRLPNSMKYQRLNDYPFLSINRVCWNPNFTSNVWILSATQSGMCRLSCVSFLNSSHNNINE